MPVEPGLKQRLSALDAVSVVIGIVIGAGIFVTPQELARMLPSSNAMMLAWVVSGALVFCGALAFAAVLYVVALVRLIGWLAMGAKFERHPFPAAAD